MKYTRSEEEAHNNLINKIMDLEERRRRVMETLVGYEFGIQES